MNCVQKSGTACTENVKSNNVLNFHHQYSAHFCLCERKCWKMPYVKDMFGCLWFGI